MDIPQSLPICCSLAALGGALETAATAVTAIPAVRAKEGIELSTWKYYMTILGNLVLQGLGSGVGHLVATWFGPVSLVVPFFFSATLLSNMSIVGMLREPFTKNMRVGTLVIVLSVVLLPSVGPTPQEDQNIRQLVWNHWYAQIWLLGLMAASAITGLLLVLDIRRYSSATTRVIILLVCRASSLAVNLTVSRSFILSPTGPELLGLVIIKLVSGSIYTSAIVVQSLAHIEQSRFVPVNATLIILVNAMTGILVWEDWRVVQSWLGYGCVFCLLGLGCDLLLSLPTTTILNSENPNFGVSKRASVLLLQGQRPPLSSPIMGHSDRHNGHHDHQQYYESIPEMEFDDVDVESEEPQAERSLDTECANPRKSGSKTAMARRVSRVDAWKELVGPMAAPLPFLLSSPSPSENQVTGTTNANNERSSLCSTSGNLFGPTPTTTTTTRSTTPATHLLSNPGTAILSGFHNVGKQTADVTAQVAKTISSNLHQAMMGRSRASAEHQQHAASTPDNGPS